MSAQPQLTPDFRDTYFQTIKHELLALKRPVTIVETGCMRPPRLAGHEWEDGQATLLWDQIAAATKGLAWSVDINSENVAYARKRVSFNTVVVCDDSVHWLTDCKKIGKIDLLYMDSVDFENGKHNYSILHHVGELAAAWPRLNSGAIVAVDDCQGPFAGKHALVRMFLEMYAGISPIMLGTICAWRMP